MRAQALALRSFLVLFSLAVAAGCSAEGERVPVAAAPAGEAPEVPGPSEDPEPQGGPPGYDEPEQAEAEPKPSPSSPGEYGMINFGRAKLADSGFVDFELEAIVTSDDFYPGWEVIATDVSSEGKCVVAEWQWEGHGGWPKYSYSIGNLTLVKDETLVVEPHPGPYVAQSLTQAGWEPQWGATYTLSAEGGELPPFSAHLTLPEGPLNVTSPFVDGAFAPLELDGAKFLWDAAQGAAPAVEIAVISVMPTDDGRGYSIECLVADDGEFSLPGSIAQRYPKDHLTGVRVRRANRQQVDIGEGRWLSVFAQDYELAMMTVH